MNSDIDQCIQTALLVTSLLSNSSSEAEEKCWPPGSCLRRRANVERYFMAPVRMLDGEYQAEAPLYNEKLFPRHFRMLCAVFGKVMFSVVSQDK